MSKDKERKGVAHAQLQMALNCMHLQTKLSSCEVSVYFASRKYYSYSKLQCTLGNASGGGAFSIVKNMALLFFHSKSKYQNVHLATCHN